MLPTSIKIQNNSLPDSAGVFLLKNEKGEIIYVHQARSLKEYILSLLQNEGAARMINETREIEYIEKPTLIERAILKANLIRDHFPKHNEEDKKISSNLVITKEGSSRAIILGTIEAQDDLRRYEKVFGPYAPRGSLQSAFRYASKIFPLHNQSQEQLQGLKLFFEGRVDELIAKYRTEMGAMIEEGDFDRAKELRDRIFLLEHIEDDPVMYQVDI